MAGRTMRALTGYLLGGCPVTVRPCREGCLGTGSSLSYDPVWTPVSFAGTWINLTCGCTTSCSCTQVCEVSLGGTVGEIEEVLLDGEVVDADNYRLDNGKLVWTGGGDCGWPLCQDMSLATDQPGTFSVTYLAGVPVDGIGAWVAGVLACEYAKAAVGGSGCRLPTGVTHIVRQGVTYTIAASAFPGGITGIPEVDSYVARVNPRHRRRPSTVFSPDLQPPRAQTWPALT
jgi:hypothetical protein